MRTRRRPRAIKKSFPSPTFTRYVPDREAKGEENPLLSLSLSLSRNTKNCDSRRNGEKRPGEEMWISRERRARTCRPATRQIGYFYFLKKKTFQLEGKEKEKKTNTKFLYFILPWVFIPSRRDFNHFPELQISFLLLSCRTWRLCMYIKATWEEREMLRRRRGDMSMATVRPFSGCGATAATVRYTGRCVTSSFWYTSRTCHLFHRMIIATTYSSLLPFW